MAEADKAITAEQEAYRNDGYVLLEGLFPPIVLSMFRGRLQEDLGLMRSRDFVRTNNLLTKPAIEVYSLEYPPMATFLWGLTPRVSQVAGRELTPSYAYFRIYQQGDICRVHSDRPACEHSMSLTLELADNTPWALSLEKRSLDQPLANIDPDFGDEPFSTLAMKAGDAVMYRGVNHRHGRLDPNPNSWSAHMFLHWVDPEGPYANHAFDRANIEAARAAQAR
ncbi:MAG TPA: hypothetical protein VF098_07940 [Sphingomicrobium sp.]|jgi:hypothetical protein